MTAYCFKCRAIMEIKNPKKVIMKNGKSAIEGICKECGTRMFRIVKG